MVGAYAMGAPWHRLAGACAPEWTYLSHWSAKMAGPALAVSKDSANGVADLAVLRLDRGGL